MDAPGADLRDYLAAERTFLAWIRTGLAFMGFGFVVARFGLFLQELQAAQQPLQTQSYGLSLWFGTALIAVGVIISLLAGWRHARLLHALDHGEIASIRPSTQVIAIALFLALIGLAMAIYLVLLRPSVKSHTQEHMERAMATIADTGIGNRQSNHSVDVTVDKLK